MAVAVFSVGSYSRPVKTTKYHPSFVSKWCYICRWIWSFSKFGRPCNIVQL